MTVNAFLLWQVTDRNPLSLVELNYPSWVPFSPRLVFLKHGLPRFPRFSRRISQAISHVALVLTFLDLVWFARLSCFACQFHTFHPPTSFPSFDPHEKTTSHWLDTVVDRTRFEANAHRTRRQTKSLIATSLLAI